MTLHTSKFDPPLQNQPRARTLSAVSSAEDDEIPTSTRRSLDPIRLRSASSDAIYLRSPHSVTNVVFFAASTETASMMGLTAHRLANRIALRPRNTSTSYFNPSDIVDSTAMDGDSSEPFPDEIFLPSL